MNSINTYKYKEHRIRVLLDEQGDFWFVAKDVGDALGILDINDALGQVDDDEKKRELIPTFGDPQRMIIVNRSGLCSLMLQTDTPEAVSFRKWISHDVIPSLHNFDMPTFIPFGPEWEKEMMKMRKIDMVALLEETLQNSQSSESPIFVGDISGKECIDALIATANAAKNFVIAYNERNNIHSIHEIKDQHLIPLVSAIESLDRLWTIKAQESPLVQ